MENDWLTNRLTLLFLPLQHLIVLPTEFFHRRKTHSIGKTFTNDFPDGQSPSAYRSLVIPLSVSKKKTSTVV